MVQRIQEVVFHYNQVANELTLPSEPQENDAPPPYPGLPFGFCYIVNIVEYSLRLRVKLFFLKEHKCHIEFISLDSILYRK